MTIINFPVSYDVRISHQRRWRKQSCEVIALQAKAKPVPASETAMQMYYRASAIDESEPLKAIEIYQAAAKMDPKLTIAYTNEGNCHFRLHNPTEAQRLYELALSMNPNQPEALYNLGYLILERGDASASIPLFKRAVAADSRFADAWFNLAMALEQTGKTAALEWQRYLSLEPKGKWAEIARRHVAI